MPIDLSKKPKYGEIVRAAVRDGKVSFEVKTSIDWFRKKARTVGQNVTPQSLMTEKERLRSKFRYGTMYHYFYDPKHKKTLPYYDIFPLVFIVEPAPKGFFGINLHYLPPTMRAKLMDGLDTIKNNRRYDETTKLILSYGILKSVSKLKYFEPCFKWYLFDHVASQFLKIEADEWNLALFLPTERFKKQPKETVWRDSRKQIKGGI